jgi:hypothetical protein
MRSHQTIRAESTSPLARALGVFLGPAAAPVRSEQEVPEFAGVGMSPLFSLSPSSSLIKHLKREGYDHLRYFVALPSQRMPRWLLPVEDGSGMLPGTEIYLPHRWAPRMLKSMVIRMANLGYVSCLWPRVLLASKGPLRLETLVREVTGVPHPIFALSLGRRASVRKLTIQVMRPRAGANTNRGHGQAPYDLLGYIKLPLADVASERVRHEAATLERLWNFPSLRKHVPRLLYAGDWNDTYVLFQSPLQGDIGPTHLNGMHEKFLHLLWNAYRIEKPGKTLIQKVGARWGKVAPLLGAKWQELGREALVRATRAINDKVLPLSVMHGDFAPWNTRVRDKDLLLFDWESADWEAPTAWDMSHFEVLTASSLGKNSGHYTFDVESGGTFFMLYLLNSVCQLCEEENHEAISYRQRLLTEQLHQS